MGARIKYAPAKLDEAGRAAYVRRFAAVSSRRAPGPSLSRAASPSVDPCTVLTGSTNWLASKRKRGSADPQVPTGLDAAQARGGPDIERETDALSPAPTC